MSVSQTDAQEMPYKSLIPKYLLIVVFNLLIIGIMLFFVSPYSKIDTVSVRGNNMVYDQNVIDATQVKKGDPLLKTYRQLKQIENTVTKQLQQVSKSKAKITHINELQIEIEEYDTVAYLSSDEIYLRVLENGTILEQEYSVSLGNQPILSGFKEGKALDTMIEELEQLEKSTLDLISEIELTKKESNPFFIKIFMNNGNQVLTSIPSFSEKISYYPEMIQAVEGEKGVFDMEAGIYFVPFKNKENDEEGLEEEQQNLEEAENE